MWIKRLRGDSGEQRLQVSEIKQERHSEGRQ